MRIITKGPIIKAQLYAVLGGILWAAQSVLGGYDYRSLSCGIGFMAIVFTSMGMYLWMNARRGPEPGGQIRFMRQDTMSVSTTHRRYLGAVGLSLIAALKDRLTSVARSIKEATSRTRLPRMGKVGILKVAGLAGTQGQFPFVASPSVLRV